MISAEKSTAEPDQAEAAPTFSFSPPPSTTCCVCGSEGATGRWLLCRPCRDRLARQYAERSTKRRTVCCIVCGFRLRHPDPNNLCGHCHGRRNPTAKT